MSPASCLGMGNCHSWSVTAALPLICERNAAWRRSWSIVPSSLAADPRALPLFALRLAHRVFEPYSIDSCAELEVIAPRLWCVTSLTTFFVSTAPRRCGRATEPVLQQPPHGTQSPNTIRAMQGRERLTARGVNRSAHRCQRPTAAPCRPGSPRR
jgi:hypothetical protein